MARLGTFVNLSQLLVSLLSPTKEQTADERVFLRIQRSRNPFTFNAVQIFHLLALLTILRDTYTSLYADYLNPDVEKILSGAIDDGLKTLAQYGEQIRRETNAQYGTNPQ